MEQIIPRMVNWIDQYALVLYGICALGVLICLRTIIVKRRERRRSIFKLEREAALARESQAFSMTFLFLGIILTITAVKFYMAPSLEAITPTSTPTPTWFLFTEPPTRAVTPTATPTPAPPTATRRPVIPAATPTPTAPPTATLPPAARCTNPGVCISYPAANMRIAGVIEVRGTATIDRFQFYKVEYGIGENPEQWHSIGDIQRQPVTNGVLVIWNATGFPPGVYKLRLTVVDITGNFGPPHEVRVILGQ